MTWTVERRGGVQDEAEVFDGLLGASEVHVGVGAHEVGVGQLKAGHINQLKAGHVRDLDGFGGVGYRALDALFGRESPGCAGAGRDLGHDGHSRVLGVAHVHEGGCPVDVGAGQIGVDLDGSGSVYDGVVVGLGLLEVYEGAVG